MPFSADIFYRLFDGGKQGLSYPVILLHGSGATHMSWPSDIRRLPGYKIFSIDLPGHGKSKGPACQSMDGLISNLHNFVTQNGFFHVILIGFSLGAAIALEYARYHPKRIKGLVVISIGSRFLIPPNITSFLRPPAEPIKAIEIFNQAAFHPDTLHSFRRKIIEPLHDVDPFILAADFHIGRIFRYQSLENESTYPITIIGGRQDQITPQHALHQLKHQTRNSRLHLIPDAGHMVIYEKTDEVKRILLDFLKEIN